MTAVVVITPDELRELVREAVRVELDARTPVATAHAPLVEKREAARALSVSSATLDRLVTAGRVPFVRVGDHRRFDLAAVRSALESVPAVASAKPSVLPGVRLLSRKTA